VALLGVGKGYLDAVALRDLLCQPIRTRTSAGERPLRQAMDIGLLDELAACCETIVTIEDTRWWRLWRSRAHVSWQKGPCTALLRSAGRVRAPRLR
jgi:hypothetical protein